MKQENDNSQQINIEISEPEAQGIYSNLALITFNLPDFIIDFIKILPGVPKTKVASRIIMSPQHAKLLMYALKNNIQKYEEMFGEIKIQDQNNPFPNFGFVPKNQEDETIN
ncbi:MAG TPA: DUF3467 domain-containing protein [Ignavibacteriales bacterium]|jgi:hypothetical protein|nr:DUF3467 domain-containing protein [Ignavibacteriales bacterium]